MAENNWIKRVVILLALTALVLLHLCDPANHAWYPRCPVNKWFGLYCAGCGSLRALHYLSQGDLQAAFRMNALTVLILPLIITLAAGEIFPKLKKQQHRIRPLFIWLILTLFLAFSILRNLPFPPFNLLAPAQPRSTCCDPEK